MLRSMTSRYWQRARHGGMENDLKAAWERLCDTLKESADQLHPDTPRVSPQARRQLQTERRRHALNRFTR